MAQAVPSSISSMALAGSGAAASAGYPAASRGSKEQEVQEVEYVEVVRELRLQPHSRLPKPHDFFPFDIFGSRSHRQLLARGVTLGLTEQVVEELDIVRDHCMMPPFPWGQIMYRKFVLGNIIQGDIPGHFAELGIGQGGTSVFFARLAKQYGRKFLAVDSFEGLPEPDMMKDNHYFVEGDYRPKDGADQLEQFMRWKSDFDVDDVMHVEKCFFKDLVIPPEFEKQGFAFVHLDSDLYDSVYDSLEKVWDLVAEGGCVAIDDFFHHAQGPARAVSDFFRTRGNPKGEPPLLYVVPTYAVLIIKGRSAFLEAAPSPEGASSSSDGRRRGRMHSPRALDGNFYSFRMVRNCKPFIKAVEESAESATRASQQEGLSPENQEAINRARINAEAFLAFLKYPESAARSGADILRYLWPLEDQWDISQGSLCGLTGEARKTIEITI